MLSDFGGTEKMLHHRFYRNQYNGLTEEKNKGFLLNIFHNLLKQMNYYSENNEDK